MRCVNEILWPAVFSSERRTSIVVTVIVRSEVAVGISREASMWRASIAAPPRSSLLSVTVGSALARGPAAGAGAALAASTSAFVMRPAGPLPSTAARSTPSAAAMRRATGEMCAPSRRLRLAACGPGSRGATGGCSAGAQRGRHAVVGRDLGEHRADRHGLTGGRVDLRERPGGRRGNLGIDLVGGHLDERLVGANACRRPACATPGRCPRGRTRPSPEGSLELWCSRPCRTTTLDGRFRADGTRRIDRCRRTRRATDARTRRSRRTDRRRR